MALTQTTLPLIQASLNAKLEAGRKLLDSFEEAGSLHEVLDNESIKNIVRAYRKEREVVDEYKSQLSELQNQTICMQQRAISDINDALREVSQVQEQIFFHTKSSLYN